MERKEKFPFLLEHLGVSPPFGLHKSFRFYSATLKASANGGGGGGGGGGGSMCIMPLYSNSKYLRLQLLKEILLSISRSKCEYWR